MCLGEHQKLSRNAFKISTGLSKKSFEILFEDWKSPKGAPLGKPNPLLPLVEQRAAQVMPRFISETKAWSTGDVVAGAGQAAFDIGGVVGSR